MVKYIVFSMYTIGPVNYGPPVIVWPRPKFLLPRKSQAWF